LNDPPFPCAQSHHPQATADDWLRRAELAVRKGQDDLAREALARRKSADSAATALKGQLDAQRRALEQLTANVRMLEGKVTEARNKRETLKSRAAAAKSSKAVQEVRGHWRGSAFGSWQWEGCVPVFGLGIPGPSSHACVHNLIIT
jgi:phage shock protein A